jgi:urea transport system ATP-binding protein
MKQWLEIGMVVASDADLLLLDEPAAGMTHQEAEATARLIRSLTGQHSFIVIDHDMDFVEQLSAPVSVLNMGRMLAHGTVDEIRRNAEVQAVYLGRAREGDVARA